MSIVQFDGFPDDIRKDLHIDQKGRVFCTTKGAARIYGVSSTAVRNARKGWNLLGVEAPELPEDSGFEGGNLLGESEFMFGLEYYAYDAGRYCTEQAKLVHRLIGRVGWRSMAQQLAGWVAPSDRVLSPKQIAEICLLPSGRGWKPRFDEDYYDEMARLTGLSYSGGKRPQLWGKLTDEWVYQMLPVGVRDGVRLARLEKDGWDKLHQFLSDDGLEVFLAHMKTLMILMRAADTVNGVRRSLKNMTRAHYQQRLFDDCRKDGALTISKQLRIDVDNAS